MYPYPWRVRFRRVRVRCGKIVPAVYPWQTLAAGGGGAVLVAPREKREEEQQLLMMLLLVPCSLQVVEVGVGSRCGGKKTND